MAFERTLHLVGSIDYIDADGWQIGDGQPTAVASAGSIGLPFTTVLQDVFTLRAVVKYAVVRAVAVVEDAERRGGSGHDACRLDNGQLLHTSVGASILLVHIAASTLIEELHIVGVWRFAYLPGVGIIEERQCGYCNGIAILSVIILISHPP